MKNFDVIIIGKGISGSIAALELAKYGFDVAIVDVGGNFDDNLCKRFESQTYDTDLKEPNCKIQYCLAGSGGAALHFEANLDNYPLSFIKDNSFSFSDSLINTFGSVGDVFKYTSKVYDLFFKLGLKNFNEFPSSELTYKKHLEINSAGTIPITLKEIKTISTNLDNLLKKNVTTYDHHTLIDCNALKNYYEVIISPNKINFKLKSNYYSLYSKNVIFAMGKRDYELVTNLSDKLGVKYDYPDEVELGVRVEVPKNWFDSLLFNDYNPKISTTNFNGTRTRIFCICDGGRIMKYKLNNNSNKYIFDGQHSHSRKGKKTNFGVLTKLKVNSENSVDLVKNFVNSLNNLENNGLPGQRVSDYIKKQKTTQEHLQEINPTIMGLTATDMSKTLNDFGIDLNYFLNLLSKEVGSQIPKESIIVGPIAEKYHPKITMDQKFRTTAKDIYFIGDCSGNVSGIVSGAAMGLKIAHTIKENGK